MPAGWHTVVVTPAQARRHRAWVQQELYRNWLAPYYKAYHLRKGGAGGQRGLQAEALREDGREGVLLHYADSIGPGNFRHFFEYLGEAMTDLGYRRACADERTRRAHRHTERALKQFFKPAPSDCPRTGRCDQRYGLVTIDLVAVDSAPLFIRLATNAVHEPHFAPADSFENLFRELFDAPGPTPDTQAMIPKFYEAF